MSYDYYYLQDGCEYTCATCALFRLKDVLDEEHREPGDPAGRLLAMIEWQEPTDIDDLFRTADIECQSWTYVGNNLKRNQAARDLLGELVSRIDDNDDASDWGENCGRCNTTLVEEYVTCDHCGHCEYASAFSYAAMTRQEEWWMDGDEGPLVLFCGRCEDDWLPGNVEEITTDRRGYDLRFVGHYAGKLTNGETTDQPIYAAGCRRFTLEQALEHWSDPMHYDRRAARQLFNGVLRHAMQRALPNLNL